MRSEDISFFFNALLTEKNNNEKQMSKKPIEKIPNSKYIDKT